MRVYVCVCVRAVACLHMEHFSVPHPEGGRGGGYLGVLLIPPSPSQGWMDTYFERIDGLSENKDLPPRIRFMLRDLADLRKNKVGRGWGSGHVIIT